MYMVYGDMVYADKHKPGRGDLAVVRTALAVLRVG
jgi:hypothetical protein